MGHFDITQWTDYVRGLVPSSEREAMAQHLFEVCERCTDLVALIQRIHDQSSSEQAVPEYLVQAAKAIFPAGTTQESGEPGWLALPYLVAKLVYNGLAGQALAGARSVTGETVQLMYHAGDWAIDLQIECEPESSEMALVGQIVDRAASGNSLAHLPVVLMARKKFIAQAWSNQFGEFCIVSRVQPGMKLCMPLKGAGKQVEIPLGRILAGCP